MNTYWYFGVYKHNDILRLKNLLKYLFLILMLQLNKKLEKPLPGTTQLLKIKECVINKNYNY